ncbi:MAG: hypothetical protein WC869_00600 [Phycisphaerae bacterium]|jgi:hypothetical protein
MPLDLLIVQADADGRLYPATWPNVDFVDQAYNLVQKIYKNLMTVPGQDQFDPAWGSDIRGALLGTRFNDPTAAKLAIQGVFQKCTLDLQSDPPVDPTMRVTSLWVSDMTFDDLALAWNISIQVYTEAHPEGFIFQVPVVTTSSQTAV